MGSALGRNRARFSKFDPFPVFEELELFRIIGNNILEVLISPPFPNRFNRNSSKVLWAMLWAFTEPDFRNSPHR